MAGPKITPEMRIVVLHGKEHFLIDEYMHRAEEVLRERHGDIEVFRFDGGEVTLATVLDELRSYGLMQWFKMVVLDNADAFLAADEGVNRKPIERYAQNPVDHAMLLLRAGTWRPSKLSKMIAEVGVAIKCDTPSTPSAVSWCMKRIEKEHGARIDRQAAATLVSRLGTSLLRLDTELAKLAALVEPGGSIDGELVTQMVGRSREEQAWDIQEAILTTPGHALTKLHELRTISQAPNELLMWSMIDLCRKLYLAGRLLKQGRPTGAVMKQARMWGSAGEVMIRAARRHPPARLARLLRDAIAADAQVKTGLATAPVRLECLAVSLADSLAGS